MLMTEAQQQIEYMSPQVSHSNKITTVDAYAICMKPTDTLRHAGIGIKMVAHRTVKKTTTDYRDPRHSVGGKDVFVSRTWKIMKRHVPTSPQVSMWLSIKVSKMRLNRSHWSLQTNAQQRSESYAAMFIAVCADQTTRQQPSFFAEDSRIDEFASFDIPVSLTLLP